MRNILFRKVHYLGDKLKIIKAEKEITLKFIDNSDTYQKTCLSNVLFGKISLREYHFLLENIISLFFASYFPHIYLEQNTAKSHISDTVRHFIVQYCSNNKKDFKHNLKNENKWCLY